MCKMSIRIRSSIENLERNRISLIRFATFPHSRNTKEKFLKIASKVIGIETTFIYQNASRSISVTETGSGKEGALKASASFP